MNISFAESLSVSLILFSVIDIVGNVPIVVDLRRQSGALHSGKATLAAGGIMLVFLFLGDEILKLLSIDISAFAIAGAIVMFLIGMQMVLGVEMFRTEPELRGTSGIVPIAFPMLAGPGTMTSLISLRAEYALPNVLVGIVVNLVLIYVVLKASGWLERKIGQEGLHVIRKVFGIILLAISIKIFKNGLALW